MWFQIAFQTQLGPLHPRYIANNAEQVKLRSFNTSVHKVEGMVSYKASDE